MGEGGAFFGQPFEDEKEDPERADRLMAGLEVVPVGLVRRMERAGGAPGAHVEIGDSNAPGCAVCWDKLLDAEGEGFGVPVTVDAPAVSHFFCSFLLCQQLIFRITVAR